MLAPARPDGSQFVARREQNVFVEPVVPVLVNNDVAPLKLTLEQARRLDREIVVMGRNAMHVRNEDAGDECRLVKFVRKTPDCVLRDNAEQQDR